MEKRTLAKTSEVSLANRAQNMDRRIWGAGNKIKEMDISVKENVKFKHKTFRKSGMLEKGKIYE